VAEREVLLDAVDVRGVDHGGFAESAQAFGVFGLGQVTATGAVAQDLAGGGYFEPLRHGLSSFDAFRTSHKFNSIAKERGM
jgi:hypothetical protein